VSFGAESCMLPSISALKRLVCASWHPVWQKWTRLTAFAARRVDIFHTGLSGRNTNIATKIKLMKNLNARLT